MKRIKIRNIVHISAFQLVMFFGFNNLVFAQLHIPVKSVIYDSAATSGYYFVAPKVSSDVGNPPGGIRLSMMVMDKFGEVIFFHNRKTHDASDFKLQPNGLITYSSKAYHFMLDSTFTVIDSVKATNNFYPDSHDFHILPNGHFVFLSAELVQMDLSSYHMFMGNNSPGSANATVRGGIIQELDTNKNVVFTWRALNYFAFDDTDPNLLMDTSVIDWNHCNAVELDNDGNFLLSIRRFNEITKINRSDSTIMWRLGGVKNQFTFPNDSLQFKTQHDIRRISNGNITLFDNGYVFDNPVHPCMAKEYKLNDSLKTAELVWSYTYDSTKVSTWLGNVQRLQNGNTIIGFGNLLGTDIIFSNVDSSGNKIFELKSFDSTVVTYRAFNYPSLPWNINRPIITCEEINGQVFLSVDSGLTSYKWNTGDSTFKILANSPDTYYVFVPRGIGFLKSEKFIYSSLSNPCNINFGAGLNSDISEDSFSIVPNPVSDRLFLKLSDFENKNLKIEIFDVFGKLVYSQISKNKNNEDISLSFLKTGIYYIRINKTGKKFVKM